MRILARQVSAMRIPVVSVSAMRALAMWVLVERASAKMLALAKIKMGQTLWRLTHFESGCGGRI